MKYLGTAVVRPDGTLRVMPYRLPPPPQPPVVHPVRVPRSVRRAIGGRGFLARVLGDSMEPHLLDYDAVVVMRRAPTDGDIVLVRTNYAHPVYGPMTGGVWRYHAITDGALLKKDNDRYQREVRVTADDLLGVVTRICWRERRNEWEHYERIQELLALARAAGHPTSADGCYPQSKRDAFAAVVSIPASELLGERLPWGCFRAIAKADHPHLGIHAGDTVTIQPTGETHVGQIVIEQHDSGEIIIGTLQRERHHEQPGDFYIDQGKHRTYVTNDNGRIYRCQPLGVIRQHARPTGRRDVQE